MTVPAFTDDRFWERFHYFRSWIVGKGKQVFNVAMSDPDQLGPFLDTTDVDNELLEYVAVEVSEARGLDDPRNLSDRNPDEEPEGTPFDEKSVADLFPNLTASWR